MTSLSVLYPRFVEAVSTIMNTYDMTGRLLDGSHISLQSRSCRIEFGFGRGPDELTSVYLYSDQKGPFNLFHITLLRNNFTVEFYQWDPSISIEENFSRRLVLVQRKLLLHCDDLLRGNPSVLIAKDRYYEFAVFMESITLRATSAPLDDPIALKYWSGDWFWLRDVWEKTLQF